MCPYFRAVFRKDLTLKKLTAILLVLSALLPLVLCGGTASALDEPQLNGAASAYLYNIENSTAVYSYKPDDTVFPTSTVKLMTGIVALELLGDRLDETVTVTTAMLAEVSGNNIKLQAGEKVKLSDMLGAMLVNGANDAAYVLAHAACGSSAEFVQRMNAKAAEIGANKTVYTNPTGIHDDRMVTTARDTCTVALTAYNTPGFMDYAELLKYTVEDTNMSSARTLYNRNCLLSLYYEQSYYYDKARGMNAGSTYEGGYCVVTTASDGALTYLAVVMDATEDAEGNICSYTGAKSMLEWAFDAFLYLDVLSPEQTVCEIPVTLSMGVDYVTLVSKDTLSVYLPADTDIEAEIKLSWTTDSEQLQAPVTKGQAVGRVTALYKDEPIGTADLVATADISRSDMLYGLYKISQFSKSRFFIAALISAVVFSLIYVFGKAILLKKRNERKFR